MLFKAFKKISEVKTNLPKDWQGEELPPVFREVLFPWEMDDDESEDPRSVPITRQEPERPAPPPEPTWAEKIGMGKTKTSVKRADLQSGGKVKQEQSVPGEFLPLMDSYNIVNGIIMSELLQPPKCKRTIQKRY